MHGSPRLDYLTSNLLDRGVGQYALIKNFSDLPEGGTEVNRSRSGEEKMVKERLDVVAELKRRTQEIRLRILGEGS
jgi:hypothetical protein